MNNCKQCNKVIEKRSNIFCNRSCAASYNNKQKPKRTKQSQTFECLNCNEKFERYPSAIAKGQNKFCCMDCTAEFKKKEATDRFRKGEVKSRQSIRTALLEQNGHICSVCNLKDWLGKPITLWVDHIDGFANNNNPSNMRLICPNCDSQNDTFGYKNKGKGRKALGMRMYG
tara:strand:- start:175 stop:687 length:513 start_codon:yes stop_codon:yes gene_type:complete